MVSPQSSKENIYLENKKLAGFIEGDTFTSVRYKTKHLFRKIGAWGFDESLLLQLQDRGVVWIVVSEQEEEVNYKMLLSEVMTSGVKRNYGHGEQLFVPLLSFEEEPF